MKLVEHYIMRGTRRLVLIIVGFLIFIFASYSAQRYLTEAANGTLALDVVQDTGQPSSEYHLALWEKLGQPILTLAMILLAVPFTFSVPRSPGMGSRLAVGVIVGLLTWISYQIMVNLGLLFALSAPVTALGLPVAFVLVALSLVYWYDRQH